MLRYPENLRMAIKRRKTGSLPQAKYARLIPITVDELQRGETEILKYVRREEFAEEIGILQVTRNESRQESLRESKKRQVKGSSRIFELDPQLVDGLLRVGGRLGNAQLQPYAKHPVILLPPTTLSASLSASIINYQATPDQNMSCPWLESDSGLLREGQQ